MPENGGPKGGWSEWSNHVLLTLEKLEKKVDKLEENIHQDKLDTQRELVTLNTKASILGSIAGVITSLIVTVIAGLIIYNITTKDVDKANTEPINHGASIELVVPREDVYSSFNIIREDDEGEHLT